MSILNRIGYADFELITVENRDKIFQKAIETLEAKLAVLDGCKRTEPRKATYQYLCRLTETGHLNISENPKPLGYEVDLSLNEFWWPCSFNGGGYDTIVDHWMERKLGSFGMKLRSSFLAYMSDDSGQFIKDEVDRFARIAETQMATSEISEEQFIYEEAEGDPQCGSFVSIVENLPDETDADRVKNHLGAAASYVEKNTLGEMKAQDLWKALEHAYLAGKVSLNVDMPEIFESGKKGHKFPTGRPRKTKKNLKGWEEVALEFWLANKKRSTADIIHHLRKEDIFSNGGYDEIKILESGKVLKLGTVRNKISQLKKLD